MKTQQDTIELLEDLALGLAALDKAWDDAIKTVKPT
jgi:hypothetical protein